MLWEQLTDEQKQACYDSYVQGIIYEWGDHACYMSFTLWCDESEKIGEAIL